MADQQQPELNYYPIDQDISQSSSEPQTNSASVPLDTSNVKESGNGSVMAGGTMQSPNYVADVAGWLLDSNGNIKGVAILTNGGRIANWYIFQNTIASGSVESTSSVLIDSANSLIRLGSTANPYITLDGGNQRIRSSDYVAGVSGFTVEPTLMESENIVGRATLKGATFQYDVVSAVGGQLIITNADTLDADMTALDASTMTTKGTTTFAVDDNILIRAVTASGIQEEYLRITDISSAPVYSVTRDLAASFAADSNPIWKKGTTITKVGSAAAAIGTQSVSVLAIGGGGGGGGADTTKGAGAGGGAGGYQYDASFSVSPQVYTVTVGAGGSGGAARTNGANGGDSSFSTITATGGGGGGAANNNGLSGGSGGGAGGSNAGDHTGGTGSQGYDGGDSTASTGGSGGGGSSAVGSNSSGTAPGAGGNGTANSISGSSVTYGGGGGGGGNDQAGASGGTGGGGAGGAAGGGSGVAGTANTGGGGGGGSQQGGSVEGAGGDGGSGVVIIRYLTSAFTATGGTITTDGLYTVHTFTTSGTFTIADGEYSGGWLRLLGEGTNSPYYSVFKRTGLTYSDFTEVCRLGNLNGFLGYSSEEYGIAIGETTKYLKYDPTNGLRVAGDITALTFIEAGQDLTANDWVIIAGDGKAYKADAGTALQTTRTIGVVIVTTTAGNQVPLQLADKTTAVSSLTPGSIYYTQTPTSVISAAGSGDSDSIYGVNWRAQTFTPGSTFVCSGAYLSLTTVAGGNPSPMTVAIKATSAGLPTGANLAEGTITSVSITGSGYFNFYVSFTTPITLTASTMYALVVSSPLSTVAGYWSWEGNATSIYAGGTDVGSSDSGSSWAATTKDKNFSINSSPGTIGTTAGVVSKKIGIGLSSTQLLILNS